MTKKLIYLGPDSHLNFVINSLPNFEVIQANSEDKVDEIISTCDVIFDAYMKVPFQKQRLSKASNLKLFITATTGTSHIDTALLAEKNIPILTLKGQEHITRGLTAAAEHSWLLLMAVARQLIPAAQEVINGGWDRNKFPGVMLKGKTIGIIGCGRIGEWMARYAKAFDMDVLGYDPYKKNDSDLFRTVELDELLSNADFVSIHVPLVDDTKLLIGEREIGLLKPNTIFINTSRGEIVNEACLLKALVDGKIKGAGIDVITAEPYIENDPLVLYAKQSSNLIITPHIGGYSPDALDIVLKFSCERIINFFYN